MAPPVASRGEKIGKRFIIAGFILFVVTLLSCFVTIRFGFEPGNAPPDGLLFGFAGAALTSVLLEIVGIVTLIRSHRKA